MNSLDLHAKLLDETDCRRRRLVLRWCRAFIRELRELLRRVPAARQRQRCATCAFNPATDKMRGFDSTCVNLKNAIDLGKPFYCHDDLPYVRGVGWTPKPKVEDMRLCGGFADIAADPKTKTAADRAAAKCAGFWPD